MSIADTQYLNIVENILDHGYFDNNRTGVRTYKLPHQIMQFDLEQEFPILTTKFVAFKTAAPEQRRAGTAEDELPRLGRMDAARRHNWQGLWLSDPQV